MAPSASEALPAEDPFAHQDAEAAAGIGGDDLENDVFDLSDVEAVAGRELIPAGVYDAYVQSAEYGTSARSGNRMITWDMLLRLPDSQEYTFRQFYHTTFDAKSVGRTKHAINVVLNGDVDWSKTKPTDIADRLGGTYCRVKVRQQNSPEYGKSMSIQEVLPPAEAMGGFTN